MKLIIPSNYSSEHLSWLLPVMAALLPLPPNLHAQAPDRLFTHIQLVAQHSSGGGACSGEPGGYSNDQDFPFPEVTALSEQHSASSDVSSTFSFVSTVAGAASATAVFSATGYQNPFGIGCQGQGAADAEADWSITRTINSPGHEDEPLIARQTMHAYGGVTVNASQDPNGNTVAVADYHVHIYPVSVAYDGYWSTNTGFSGTPLASLETFTYDRGILSGQPFRTEFDAYMRGGGGVDASSTGSGDSYASGNIYLRAGSIVVLDENNQPVDYTLTSGDGHARGQVTAPGTIYGGFSLTNDAPDRFCSTFQLLDGTARHQTNVVATFVAPLDIKAASDVVDLSGTDGDLQVVQIDWDPNEANLLGPLVYLEIAFVGSPATHHWVSATFGNYNGPPAVYRGDRAYNPAIDFHLGYWGADTISHKAWAVINHSSSNGGDEGSAKTPDQAPSEALFAVGIPFDLVSVVSRKTHGGAGTFDINMPLTGPRGVECRNSGGNHTLVFTFKSNLADAGDVSVTAGSGTVSGTPTISGNTMTVNLTGVANAQVTTISLHNTKDVANQVLDDTSINIGFLTGDTSGNGSVNAGDVSQTKGRIGQAVNATNFRSDVNANGGINAGDASLVKSKSGSALPP